MEKVLWLIKQVENDLQSFLLLLTFWPNNSLLWGCLLHWKMFSSTPGLSPLGANNKRELTYQNIQINKVIGENEKCIFCFMEKKHSDFLANPIRKFSLWNQNKKKIRKLGASPEEREIEATSKYVNIIRKKECFCLEFFQKLVNSTQ